ncbi:hypothetical protein NE619_13275 [Anaerovorax odorimutans]|uniref:XRE family transcriptional regulator n=1 Tax=Anaerovorax odorimutans TaxID=109327 RepID=A0ABT1RR71_9FIRM|nr:hypothetical protein [Anaerovorax odorimutans]MCQ4637699.1 hypothetical protein [Anaerovorax odorimutans]
MGHYPNLLEEIKLDHRGLDELAKMINVTPGLLYAAAAGEEELTIKEFENLRNLLGYPRIGYLLSSKKALMNRRKGPHVAKLERLREEFCEIYKAYKGRSECAKWFIEKSYFCQQFIKLYNDFQSGESVTYARFRNAKRHIQMTILGIEIEKKEAEQRAPRGLSNDSA